MEKLDRAKRKKGRFETPEDYGKKTEKRRNNSDEDYRR
jgi:hypothetical protein